MFPKLGLSVEIILLLNLQLLVIFIQSSANNSFFFHLQQMEEIWREMRWMMDALQHARYKQPSCAVPLTWFLNMAGDILLKEKPQSNSSHLDYFPSPTASPEINRKLNSGE